MKKHKMSNPSVLRLPIIIDSWQYYRLLVHELDFYRKVARKAAAELAAVEFVGHPVHPPLFLAQPELKQWYKDNQKALKEVWSALLSGQNQKMYYTPIEGLIHTLAPTWKSWLCQELSRDIMSRWVSKDPELDVPRAVLVRAGRRLPMQYMHAPLPLQNTEFVHALKLTARGVTLEWDRQIGPVNATLAGKLDSYTYKKFIWLRDNPAKMHSAKLHLADDGHFRLDIPYESELTPEQQSASKALSAKRMLEAAFTDNQETFIVLSLREGNNSSPLDYFQRKRELSALGIVPQLTRLGTRQDAAKAILKACGGSGVAFAAEQKHRAQVTKLRDNLLKNWIGTWTKIIVDEAVRRECGKLAVFDMPDTLFLHVWQRMWFKFALEYKAKRFGIQVSWVNCGSSEPEPVKVSPVIAEA